MSRKLTKNYLNWNMKKLKLLNSNKTTNRFPIRGLLVLNRYMLKYLL